MLGHIKDALDIVLKLLAIALEIKRIRRSKKFLKR